MKSIHVAALLIIVAISAGTLSCKKEVQKSLPDNNNHSAYSIPHSEWFQVNWQNNQANVPVAELTGDMLTNGKILVYATGGFENNQYPVILPAYLDANRINDNASIGNLELEVSGTGAVSNSLSFKYILIPAIVLAQSKPLDYSNYNAVCEYYNLDH